MSDVEVSVTNMLALKRQMRQTALSARKLAFEAPDRLAAEAAACAQLRRLLLPYNDKILAGYMPMRDEISPLAAMSAHAGPVCVPVIVGRAQPLTFHRWHKDAPMKPGTYGALVPTEIEVLIPDIVIVPLVAFTTHGQRLGYGGGFYDRTLESLRHERPDLIAIGFAFEEQKHKELPQEPTDQRLHAIITPQNVIITDLGAASGLA